MAVQMLRPVILGRRFGRQGRPEIGVERLDSKEKAEQYLSSAL
jgi:hypothetical protein